MTDLDTQCAVALIRLRAETQALFSLCEQVVKSSAQCRLSLLDLRLLMIHARWMEASGYLQSKSEVARVAPHTAIGGAVHQVEETSGRSHWLTSEQNGGKTGAPPGLLQDDHLGLSNWLSRHGNARQLVRQRAREIQLERARAAQQVRDMPLLGEHEGKPLGNGPL